MKIRIFLIALVAISLVTLPVFAKNDTSNGKSKPLPPGLHKKYAEGKPLPPGWQKKLSQGDILDNSIYTRGRIVVPLGSDGTLSIEVEGSIIKLHEKTREIINILSHQ